MASAQTRNTLLVLGVLAGISGAAAGGWFWQSGNVGSDYVIAPIPPGAAQISILFVGNSYTALNNLPRMVKAIAANSQNPEDIDIGLIESPGARLVDTVGAANARAFAFSQHWDYVVLQEQSLMTMQPGNLPVLRTGFLQWNQIVHTVGAMPVVFETWARQPGSASYTGPEAVADNLTTAATMQAQIDFTLGDVGDSIGAMIVPVGDVWMRCETQPGASPLYADDGSHPSLAGTYLTALLFYRMLTGHDATSTNFIPPGLTPAAADLLRRCAG